MNCTEVLYSKVTMDEGLHDTASVPFFVVTQKKYRAVAWANEQDGYVAKSAKTKT